jgi:CRISPR-associated protein Cas2
MMVVVSYDVAKDNNGQRRLRKVARACTNYGQRVQYSVFECLIDPQQWVALRHKLRTLIDEEYDSLRFYMLGANWKKRIEHIGAKKVLDPEGPMIL